MVVLWETIIAGFIFLMGASIGSFLNVVIYRLPANESIVHPRSRCPKCGHQITWYENIPILSYILLGAKCKECKSPISIQYPMIELLTATLALAIYFKFGLSWSLPVYFVFAAALIAVTFIDIPYQIIPNEISLPGIALGFGASFLTHQVTWVDSLVGAAVGFSLIALIAVGYYILTKREGMGMGDAKLLAMIAAFLGWQSIPFILMAASLQGLVIALVAITFGWMRKEAPLPDPEDWENGERPEAEEVELRLAAVPFGPFLSLAALEFLFFGQIYLEFLQSMGR